MRPEEIASADLEACQAILERGSKTFALAARFLAREVVAPATVFYAFCRISDDRIDEAPDDPMAGLEELEQRLDQLYRGEPADHPVDRALSVVVERWSLPIELPRLLLDGYRWDVEGRRYETLGDLEDYALRVAGSVGEVMATFMDATDETRRRRARALGIGMQLTNVARDVGEDARRGRIYLPLDWLRAEGIDPDRLLEHPESSPALERVVKRLLGEADAFYREADLGIEALAPRHRRSIRAARLFYSDIGRSIEAQGFDAIQRRATVSLPRKLWLAVRALNPLTPTAQSLAGPSASTK